MSILITLLLLIKIALASQGSLPQSTTDAPLFSLTHLKRHYNPAFFYRLHTLELEHQGDLHGERQALSKYDATALGHWFQSLDALEKQPDLLPFLAAFYFGASPNADVRKVCIELLERQCDFDPPKKWRWLAHGLALQQTLGPSQNTLRLAQKLATLARHHDLPLWVRQAEAHSLAQQGQKSQARALYLNILEDSHCSLSTQERAFLHFLVDQN